MHWVQSITNKHIKDGRDKKNLLSEEKKKALGT